MSLTINIYYTGENGNAKKFAEEMVKTGVVDRVRAEKGNKKYEYFFPMDDPETVLLIDKCEFIEYQDDEYGCGVIGKVVKVTANENVMKGDNVDIALVDAIAFDPYTHGYYKIGERVGNAFKDGMKLKVNS